MRVLYFFFLNVLSLFFLLTLTACSTLEPNATSVTTTTESVFNMETQSPAEHNNNQTTEEDLSACPLDSFCSTLPGDCINCNYSTQCIYGQEISLQCHAKQGITCQGEPSFIRSMVCQFCYQTPSYQHTCTTNNSCSVAKSIAERYRANCTVDSSLLCLGSRRFFKMRDCNWSSGYRWTTALALSITLGGFGVDRFYLGLWQSGIGKLFSFGGLGAWTLIDVILIATGYVRPADGSFYIF